MTAAQVSIFTSGLVLVFLVFFYPWEFKFYKDDKITGKSLDGGRINFLFLRDSAKYFFLKIKVHD